MAKPKSATNPAITFGEECHPGLKRGDNQDSVAHKQTPFGDVFVISDGVGGYYGGAEASGIIVSGLPRHLASMSTVLAPEVAITEAIQRVNAEVYAAGQSGDASRRRMSATVVLALLCEGQGRWDALVANVGDSRAYLHRDGRLSQLSTDHTAVQGMIDVGILTPVQARDHPNASVLTQTVGQTPEAKVSLKRIPLQAGDQVLLCSDGLHSYVNESAIVATLDKSKLPATACAAALRDLALAAGGPDNISVQVIRLSGKSPTRPGLVTMPRKPLVAATYAAAAILVASAAGVGGYSYFQERTSESSAIVPRALPTASAPAPVSTTVPAPQPMGAPSQEAEQTSPPPVRQAPRIFGVKPEEGPELEYYEKLRRKIQGFDIDLNIHPECRDLMESNVRIAYYSSMSVIAKVTDDPEFKAQRYKLRLQTHDVIEACGKFDLILIPQTGTETANSVVQDAEKLRDVAIQEARKLPKKTRTTISGHRR